jgi:hypothetical protein
LLSRKRKPIVALARHGGTVVSDIPGWRFLPFTRSLAKRKLATPLSVSSRARSTPLGSIVLVAAVSRRRSRLIQESS